MEALADNGIPFILVYPSLELKEVYLGNYARRGNDEGFMKFIGQNWDNFIGNMISVDCFKKFELQQGQYIEHIVGLL